MDNRDGKTTGERRVVAGNRPVTAHAETTAAAISGAQAHRGSFGVNGNRFRFENRHRVGRSAAGVGLWERHVLLAAAARLAGRRGVGPTANPVDRTLGPRRQNRLVPGGRRLQQRARCFWGTQTGPNPVDRSKPGSKHHVLTDAEGVPLVTMVSAANHHDSRYLFALLAGLPDALRAKILRLYADRAYDSAAFRERLQTEGIKPFLAKRGTAHGSGLGCHRWVVERTISWLHQFRRLRVRYERLGYMHRAFLSLAASLIAARHLKSSFC